MVWKLKSLLYCLCCISKVYIISEFIMHIFFVCASQLANLRLLNVVTSLTRWLNAKFINTRQELIASKFMLLWWHVRNLKVDLLVFDHLYHCPRKSFAEKMLASDSLVKKNAIIRDHLPDTQNENINKNVIFKMVNAEREENNKINKCLLKQTKLTGNFIVIKQLITKWWSCWWWMSNYQFNCGQIFESLKVWFFCFQRIIQNFDLFTLSSEFKCFELETFLILWSKNLEKKKTKKYAQSPKCVSHGTRTMFSRRTQKLSIFIFVSWVQIMKSSSIFSWQTRQMKQTLSYNNNNLIIKISRVLLDISFNFTVMSFHFSHLLFVEWIFKTLL